MDKTPTISIIVPVYNVEKYLRQCIDSILAQTYTDFELLLIDDGSPDNSGNICDEYAQKDPHIRVFHKPNGGVSTARNLGIDNARGEWIAFVDSDDAVKPNYLSTFMELEQKHGADFIVTSVESTYEVQKGREQRGENILEDEIYDIDNRYKAVIYLRNKGLLGVPWNKLYSASIIRDNNVRFDKDIWSYEDEIFVVQYLKYVKKIVTSAVVTYKHIARGGSTLSGRYIPMELHFRTATILDNAGKALSDDKEYMEHLKYQYVRHITRVVATMYFFPIKFSRKERLYTISRTIEKATKEGIVEDMYSQLKGYGICFRSPSLIDINGRMNRLYSSIKSKIRKTLL